MGSETIMVTIPRAVVSDDGLTATIGFPRGQEPRGTVTQCGDGVHVFKPLTWGDDDWLCVCGNVEPGLAVLWGPAVETVIIPCETPGVHDDARR